MKIILPSYTGKTKVYSLRETKRGLELRLIKSIDRALVGDMVQEVEEYECLLVDSCYPKLVEELKKEKVYVISGAINTRLPDKNFRPKKWWQL